MKMDVYIAMAVCWSVWGDGWVCVGGCHGMH